MQELLYWRVYLFVKLQIEYGVVLSEHITSLECSWISSNFCLI